MTKPTPDYPWPEELNQNDIDVVLRVEDLISDHTINSAEGAYLALHAETVDDVEAFVKKKVGDGQGEV